jgi:hypothetical protein
LPLAHAANAEVSGSAPTVQMPIREKAGRIEREGEKRDAWSFASGAGSSERQSAAASVSFRAPASNVELPPPLPSDPSGLSNRVATSAPQTESAVPPDTARGAQRKSTQEETALPAAFTADLEKAAQSETSRVRLEELVEKIWNAPEPARPEEPVAEPDTFVADLRSRPPKQGARSSKGTMGDVRLDDGLSLKPPASFSVGDAADAVGSDAYAPSHPVEDVQRPRRRHSALVAAIFVIVIAAGGGGAWLYYTGRTNWLNPQFVISQVTGLITSLITSPSARAPSAQRPSSPASSAAPTSALSPPPHPSGPPDAGASQATSGVAPHSLSPQGPPAASGAGNLGATTSSRSEIHVPASQSRRSLRAPPPEGEDSAVEGAIRRGNYYFLLGQYDEAIRIYEDALKQSPANPKLLDRISRARRAKTAEAQFLGH